MLFLIALVLGPAALICGFVLGVLPLVYVGVAIILALVLLLTLGHFF